MEKLLRVREEIVFFYKRHETVIGYLLRFLAGLTILGIVNGIGQYNARAADLFTGGMALPFLLLEAMLFMLLPATLGNAVICLNVVLQTSKSLEVAFFLFLALTLVLVFYSRIAGRESLIVVAMILGFYFRIPYAVVLFVGLYYGLTSIIPVTIGTYIWAAAPIVGGILKVAPVFDFSAIDAITIWNNAASVFVQMASGFGQALGSLFSAFVYAMAILAVFALGRLKDFDYAKEISIVIGAITLMIGFVVGIIVSSIQVPILEVILFVTLSAAIVEFARFFDIALNYRKADQVEFQDEENYYYVRVIPKVILKRMQPDAEGMKKLDPRLDSRTVRARVVTAPRERAEPMRDTLLYVKRDGETFESGGRSAGNPKDTD
ncbi:MAG: hypothetical protein LBK41_04850 [Clostridiales bacterium]|nr:hypothetical protein [Clostridiales bacterium]